MNALVNLPLLKWVYRNPRKAAWIVLSVGMIFLLVMEIRHVGLLITQWIPLIIATILVAGLCVWVISWEDRDDAPDECVH